MKFSTSEIKELADALHTNKLTQVSYSQGDCSITLKASNGNEVEQTNNTLEKVEPVVLANSQIEIIKCPLIGHFYLTATPDSEPFIKVGDEIKAGDVIGILQAMKVSNEIKSEISGIVENITVESGQFVDYDYALVEVRV